LLQGAAHDPTTTLQSASLIDIKNAPTNSKAVGGTANGFAFVPYTYRFLGRQSLGCRTGGEEMRLHLRPKGRRGDPVRPKKNSASADALKRKLTALGSRGRRGA
jgi:hypothetical protein